MAEEIQVNATKLQIEEFKQSILWQDIVRELEMWKTGFALEMGSLVDDAATNHPSTAEVLMHLGDLNGRQKAIDYVLNILDVFLGILNDKTEVSDGNGR